MGEECHTQFAPCANEGCDWKWGAWGEDVFTQRCMDHHYVDKVEAFDMTTDGACAADRPEGEKKNKKWHAEDCSQLKTVTASTLLRSRRIVQIFPEPPTEWTAASRHHWMPSTCGVVPHKVKGG